MEESAKSKNRKLTFVSNISFSNQVDLNSRDMLTHGGIISSKRKRKEERGGEGERERKRERENE